MSDGEAAGGMGGSVGLDTFVNATFTGVNSYSGGTFLEGGTLTIASDAALGAASGAVTFDGGTLDITSASFSSSRAFVLNAVGGTVDYDYSGTVIVAGFSGVGVLTKTGGATAILENNSNGGTINAEGLMEVGTTASGALTGAGGFTTLLNGAVTNDSTLDIVNADTTGLTSLTDQSSCGVNLYNSTSTGAASVNLNGTGVINFYDASSAGQSTIDAGTTESLSFHDTATAGGSIITMSGDGLIDYQADLVFHDSSNAGHAIIYDRAFDSEGGNGNLETITFADESSTASATIYNGFNGDSTIQFIDNSTAGDITIKTINNAQTRDDLEFDDNSSAGNSSLEVGYAGIIAFKGRGPKGDYNNSAGSISMSDGVIELYSTRLTVGSNNTSTEVDASITGSGSLVKVGSGTLKLASNGNSYYGSQYSGGTTVEDGTVDLAAAQGAGAGDFTFAGSSGSVATLALEAAVQPSGTSTFGNTIDNFGFYNVLDLSGLAYMAGATATVVGNTLVVVSDAKTEQFPLGGTEAAAYAVSRGMNNEAVVTAACYAAGTLISTARGAIAIDDLRVGDLVVTASGAARPIRWLGHRTVDCRRHPRPADVLPVRIAAHAFDENRPARDLFVSPGHAICVDIIGEVLIPANALINGHTIAQVGADEVTYWHVELDDHDVILAENLPSESYLEMGNRGFFVEGGVIALPAVPDARPLHTHADFCRPFHAGGTLVEAVRLCLVRRASQRLRARLADVA